MCYPSDCVVITWLGPCREEKGSFHLVLSNLKVCKSLSVCTLSSFPRCGSRTHTLSPTSGFQNSGFNQVSQISLSPQISLSSQKPHDQAEEFLWCCGWNMNPGKSLTPVSQLRDLGSALAMSPTLPQLTAQFPTILTSAWIFLWSLPCVWEARPSLTCMSPSCSVFLTQKCGPKSCVV